MMVRSFDWDVFSLQEVTPYSQTDCWAAFVVKSCVRLSEWALSVLCRAISIQYLLKGGYFYTLFDQHQIFDPHLPIFGITFMILGRLELNPLRQNTIMSRILSTKLIYSSTWLWHRQLLMMYHRQYFEILWVSIMGFSDKNKMNITVSHLMKYLPPIW